MSLSEATRSKLASLIASDRVVLFMKGNRAMPQCGFSARVVQILENETAAAAADTRQDGDERSRLPCLLC